ncbi:MAG: undecaprenyl-diphosphate phosphatase [Nitrospira sp.]|nr:undecaprenyl-diphosphate phosphatase [Nitrospira sp.]MDH4328247.1 undecaprenyl-diphosphate phosphatase [Nitrospira sp.]MDH5252311.1 undecaprenyl-diphosphate phosphatase [Nitrospira sp.]MDH5625259.1 undecaprenyl-diphosphate phosphatase [Nitrospira sp.]
MNEWGPILAVILGIVEGLTEFLPVSSTGHLILVGHALGFTGDVASNAEISIQLGAILAVIVFEREKIGRLVSGAWQEQAGFRSFLQDGQHPTWTAGLKASMQLHPNLWFMLGLGIAFLPAALVGVTAHGWIKSHLFTPHTVATTCILGGIIILAVEATSRTSRAMSLDQVSPMQAFWIGLAQCASLIPGMSRSGSTIIGGLLAGLDRKVATEYSFFLALPTIIAATVYETWKARATFTEQDFLALGIGMVVSFLVAWAVIAAFLTYIQRHTLRVFAYYRIILGVAVFLAVK